MSICAYVCLCLCVCAHVLCVATINRGRFTGLNFHGFQEYRKSFSMNLYLYLYKLHIMALFKCFKCKAPQKFSHKKTSLGGIRESLAQHVFLRLRYMCYAVLTQLTSVH